MSAACNPSVEVEVGRGAGLLLQINNRAVDDTYGAIVMAELAQLCEFPAARVEVNVRCRQRPVLAAMARLVAAELERNEIRD